MVKSRLQAAPFRQWDSVGQLGRVFYRVPIEGVGTPCTPDILLYNKSTVPLSHGG
jgi:hypothetical protein